MTLDAAIDEVLNERPGRSYHEIATQIARRELYVKADGLPAEPKQINARVRTAKYRSKYRVDDNGLVWPA